MTIRSRPVLDRKHRPRWQDELRTQQLTIAGFAIAIAVALGIFGAAAWNGWWESHLRPVAAVAGSTYTRSDLETRREIITAETVSRISDLSSQLGGPRDQLLEQQIDSLTQGLNSVETDAADSLVDGAVLREEAGSYGVSVSDEEVDAAIAQRSQLAERVRARVIVVDALPEDAEADDEPSDEQMETARAEAADALERLEGGAEFATVAQEVSDDFTAASGGELGWFADDDAAYDEYFDALAGAEPGDLVGPVEREDGYAVLELQDRREATTEGGVQDLLDQRGVSDDAYRAYVREELLVDAYEEHFAQEVLGGTMAQRRVAEILIGPAGGTAVPQERARHVLVQPDPELDDQAEASDEEWDAALEEAQEVQELVEADDADWFAIAEEHSDDTGSGGRGGDLGWYDPASSPFVTEFASALADLEVGEVSDPVRTEFGYHIIQKTGERESPEQQAADLVEELRSDPDSFAEVAGRVSESYATAEEGGEVGWVAPYQLDRMREEAVFSLTEVGEISDPVDAGEDGILIYQLLETSEDREIEGDRLEQIRNAGFERWLDEEVRATVETWVDPQFVSTTAGV
jgi:parvulin-like peptidyl-prolyl isomerase